MKEDWCCTCCYISCCVSCVVVLFCVTAPVILLLGRGGLQVEFVGTMPSTDNTISYTDNNTAFNVNGGFLRFNVISYAGIKTTIYIDTKVTILICKDNQPMQTINKFIYCFTTFQLPVANLYHFLSRKSLLFFWFYPPIFQQQ